MKNITLLICCPFFISVIHAQDILTMKNGDEIKTKILEITPTEIKYKKFENLEGVLYVINKTDAFMVKYENGTKEVFTIAQNENKSSGSSDNKETYKKGNSHDSEFYRHKGTRGIVSGAVLTGIGVPCLGAGIGLLVSGLSYTTASTSYYGSDIYSVGVIIGGAVLGAAGLAMSIVGPITLGRGVHYKKLARNMKPELSFAPVYQPAFSANTNMKAGAGFRLVF